MKAKDAIALLAKRLQDLEARVAELEKRPAGGELDEDVGDPFATEPTSKPAPRTSKRLEEPPRQQAMVEVGGQIEFAAPTPSQRRLRQRLIPHLGFEHWRIGKEGSPPLEAEEAAKAYIKGGPLWLHMYDREFVMSLPTELRQAMVLDIEEIDSEAARRLGADILKDEDPGTPEDAIEKDRQWRKHHGGATGAVE